MMQPGNQRRCFCPRGGKSFQLQEKHAFLSATKMLHSGNKVLSRPSSIRTVEDCFVLGFFFNFSFALVGTCCEMGVSENSVPLNPMVLLILIPIKNGYFIGNINPTFSDNPKCCGLGWDLNLRFLEDIHGNTTIEKQPNVTEVLLAVNKARNTTWKDKHGEDNLMRKHRGCKLHL